MKVDQANVDFNTYKNQQVFPPLKSSIFSGISSSKNVFYLCNCLQHHSQSNPQVPLIAITLFLRWPKNVNQNLPSVALM